MNRDAIRMFFNLICEPEFLGQRFDGFVTGSRGGVGGSDEMKSQFFFVGIVFEGVKESFYGLGHVAATPSDVNPVLESVGRIKDVLGDGRVFDPVEVGPVTGKRNDQSRDVEAVACKNGFRVGR